MFCETWKSGPLVAVSLAVMMGFLPAARAQVVINYPNGFAGQPSQIVPINGSSFSGSTVLLSAGSVHAGNNVWASTPVNMQAFTTTFTWTFNCTGSPTDCGDGMGFIWMSMTNPDSPGYWAGWSGSAFSWALGCPEEGGTGCTHLNSVFVKFDMYGGPNGGPGQEFTGLFTGGEYPQDPPTSNNLDMSGSDINMQSGDLMRCTFSYNGTVLTEVVTDTVTNKTFTTAYTIDIPAEVGGNTGFVGFGGGTGAATVQTNIDSWVYTVESPQGPAVVPTFSPAAGTYLGPQNVTLASGSSGVVICYNTTGSPETNGSTGCTSGTPYKEPIAVASSETLYAVAGGTGYDDSPVASAGYVLDSTVPTTTTLTASATQIAIGKSVAFTAKVVAQSGKSMPTGSIKFFDGTTALGKASLNASGSATWTATTLAAGKHTITASYFGVSGDSSSVSNAVSVAVN
jgi:hypothetical protein